MLKSPTENINKNYHTESNSLTPFNDHNVELYIQSLFKVSPRYTTRTAPAQEWFELLKIYNEREGHYILTQQQMDTIEPYCEANQEVEMTPDDFIRLLFLIRHDKINQQQQQQQSEEQVKSNSAKKLLDSRPRSSRLLSRKKYYDDNRYTSSQPEYSSTTSNYRDLSIHGDDEDSVNHPGINTNMNHPDMRYNNDRRSDYHNNNNIHYSDSNSNKDASSTILKELKREKNIATRQLKEYETRILNMSKEHSERISKLQTRLEYMTIDAEQQKTQLIEQKHKERERLDKIAELQTLINEADTKTSITLKKYQKKTEELESIKEKLSSTKETQLITENKLHDIENELFQAREVIRLLEKEKSDLHVQIEHEKRLVIDTREELDEQQSENTKLLEIIDRQKFDLDEARSGLRYFTTSPLLDKKSLNINNNTEEASLAHEQIEAEYLKKLKLVQDERDELISTINQNEQQHNKSIAEYKKKLSNVEKALSDAVNIQSNQLETIQKLSSQFDQQHKVIDSITSTIKYNQENTSPTSSRLHKLIYYFLLLFFVFHLIQLSSFIFFHTHEFVRTPTLYLMQCLADGAFWKLR